jgi:hypothetical protein
MDNEKTLVQKKKILPTLGKNKKFSVTLFFKKKSKLEHYRHNTLFYGFGKGFRRFLWSSYI